MSNQDAQKEVRQNIISLFEIDKMPEEKQEEMINKIGKIIFQSVLLRVLPLMEEEDLQEYENLIEKGVPPDELMDFFIEKVPGFLQIVGEESESFRKDAGEVLSQI